MATCVAIIVCHSERCEAATQWTKSARPGFQSQPVIRADQPKIQRCFASLNMTKNFSACEKLPIIAIPITLKPLARIVLFLQIQKFFKLRIAGSDLLGFREFVIRQVITSAASDREINESAERTRR